MENNNNVSIQFFSKDSEHVKILDHGGGEDCKKLH